MAAALEPQAALEEAAVRLLCSDLTTGLGYIRDRDCGRTFDGQPPPRSGNVFVAVWSGGDRGGQWRTALFETLNLAVTISIRTTQPYDRWVQHRDDLEARLNRISELLGMDCHDYRVTNLAETLAGFDGSSQPVGYREGLAFEGYDKVQIVGEDWFHAESNNPAMCGLVQTARFGGNKRIRRLANLR